MRVRTILLTSVMAMGLFADACATVTERGTAPTSVEPSSGQSREGPIPPIPNPPLSEDCDAAKAQWAVGERASSEILERARVAAQAKSARFLRPNQPITMEYSGSRLNLELNEQDVVRSVRCG